MLSLLFSLNELRSENVFNIFKAGFSISYVFISRFSVTYDCVIISVVSPSIVKFEVLIESEVIKPTIFKLDANTVPSICSLPSSSFGILPIPTLKFLFTLNMFSSL